MNALARNTPFLILTFAAVIALIVTSWIFTWGAVWSWRIAGGAVTVLLWAVWFGAYRLRLREDSGPEGAISPPDAARNRYMLINVPFVLAYVFTLLWAVRFVRETESELWRLAAVAAPVLILALWALEFARMVRRADEMVKAAHFRALAIAGGAVVLTASVWGIFVVTLGWPYFPAVAMLLPLYAIVYSITFGAQGLRS